MPTASSSDLRTEFAARLSSMYAREVPAYQRLVDVSREVNMEVLRERGEAAEDLGSISRVTAERHGAVRVGTPAELHQLGRILAAFGMHPVGFYDLREAASSPVPVVSTAFRPIAPQELAQNPFRLFVSVLIPDDRRFFDPEMTQQIQVFLAGRRLFPPRLLTLADHASADGLPRELAEELLRLAVASLELTDEPIDRAWYLRLANVSSVAADIAGVPATHLNHLTPRVLDIDALHARMRAEGVAMLDRIEGPPAWDGPEVLLRQTSFRALDETRRLRQADGTVSEGTLRVRFGEVEARGVALSPSGLDRYEQAMAQAASAAAAGDDAFPVVLRRCWAQYFPESHADLAATGLGHYTFDATGQVGSNDGPRSTSLLHLLNGGWIVPHPIVYEDFLPRSAAGIFESNLDSRGRTQAAHDAVPRDADWLEGVLNRPLHDVQALSTHQAAISLGIAADALGLPHIDDDRTLVARTAPA